MCEVLLILRGAILPPLAPWTNCWSRKSCLPPMRTSRAGLLPSNFISCWSPESVRKCCCIQTETHPGATRVACSLAHRYDRPYRQRCPGRSVAQPGSASAWGAEGREFESLRSDHFFRHLRERPDGPAAASNPVAITRQVKFPPWRRPICDLRPHPFAGGFRRVDVADPLFYLPAGG